MWDARVVAVAAGVLLMVGLTACGPEDALFCTGSKARLMTEEGDDYCGYRCRTTDQRPACSDGEVCVRVRDGELPDDPHHDGVCAHTDWLCDNVDQARISEVTTGTVTCP